MYTKTALILMIIILSLYPATGDVPVDGIVQYPYQYLITNAGSFPEFTFLTSSENWGFDHPALVINGSFGGGYNQDGFILHAIASTTLDETIRARLGGSSHLPVVVVNADRTDKGDRMASTIRHNRARGKHQVGAMSEIVQDLARRNWSDQRIGKELGMSPDEVLRLKQISGLAEMFADEEFSEAWEGSF